MGSSIDCYKCSFSSACNYVKYSPELKPEAGEGCPFKRIAELEEYVEELKSVIRDQQDDSMRNIGVQM